MPLSVERIKMVARKRIGSQSGGLPPASWRGPVKRYECLGLCYLMAGHGLHPKAGSGSRTASAVIGDSVWLRRSEWTACGKQEYLQRLRRTCILQCAFQIWNPYLHRAAGRDEITLKPLYTRTYSVFSFPLQKEVYLILSTFLVGAAKLVLLSLVIQQFFMKCHLFYAADISLYFFSSLTSDFWENASLWYIMLLTENFCKQHLHNHQVTYSSLIDLSLSLLKSVVPPSCHLVK